MKPIMNKTDAPPTRSNRARVVALAVLTILALVALVAFAWPTNDPEKVWGEARKAFDARDFRQLEIQLEHLGRLRSPTPLDRMLRAQLEMFKDQNQEAIADLSQVSDDHPFYAQAQLQIGQLELRKSRYGAAEAAFLKALAHDPKQVKARRELVYIYGMQLRRTELNATFQELMKISSLTYPEVFLWCLTRGVTWEPKEIAETLGRCIEADPNDRWARLGQSEALREQGLFDQADSVLGPLPLSDPDARAARVRIALDRGDPSAAEELLEAGPADHLGLALLRGQLAQVRNDPSTAVRQFRIAHDQAPNLREAILGLGQALQMAGDPGAAGPLLELARKHERLGTLVQKAAVETNRSDPGLINDLGDACAAIGRIPEARAWYNLAITRDGLDTRAQNGLARIKDAGTR